MTRKKPLFIIAAIFTAALGLATVLVAAPAAINIIHPLEGKSYPVMNPPAGKITSAQVAFSFTAACAGQGREVRWSVDGRAAGEALFDDEFSVEFTMTLAAGDHTFDVRTSCDLAAVRFKVGG